MPSDQAIREPSREEAIRLLKSGLDVAMMSLAAGYSIPFGWIAAQGGKPVILDNGTAFMLDCGAGPFLVTNEHVRQGYLKALEASPDAVCFLGNLRFDLRDRYIASDPAWDVATFRITAEEIEQLKTYASGKMVLTGSQKSWPPEPPQIDRGVFFVGFPGNLRSMRPYAGGPVEIDWAGFTALAVATSVSDKGITLYFDSEQCLDINHLGAAPDDDALGGCSGAPLLTFVDDDGLYSWRLGGIVYECGGLILKASLASCLNPDGTLNAYPDPMAYRRKD